MSSPRGGDRVAGHGDGQDRALQVRLVGQHAAAAGAQVEGLASAVAAPGRKRPGGARLRTGHRRGTPRPGPGGWTAGRVRGEEGVRHLLHVHEHPRRGERTVAGVGHGGVDGARWAGTHRRTRRSRRSPRPSHRRRPGWPADRTAPELIPVSTGCSGAVSTWTIAGSAEPPLSRGQNATRPARWRMALRPDSCRVTPVTSGAPDTSGSQARGSPRARHRPAMPTPWAPRRPPARPGPRPTSACRSAGAAVGSFTSSTCTPGWNHTVARSHAPPSTSFEGDHLGLGVAAGSQRHHATGRRAADRPRRRGRHRRRRVLGRGQVRRRRAAHRRVVVVLDLRRARIGPQRAAATADQVALAVLARHLDRRAHRRTAAAPPPPSPPRRS